MAVYQPLLSSGWFLACDWLALDSLQLGFYLATAGLNTFAVTLRVIGGDEKGSLKLETVKYGCESQGT
jgi:hypothetical protein